MLPESILKRWPDPGVTGLTNPAVYITIYDNMGKLWYVRTQLQYGVASLNADIHVPPDLMTSPFTMSYENRGPEPLNTFMDIVLLIPQ